MIALDLRAAGRTHLFPDDWWLSESSKDGAIIGPDLHMIAASVFIEELARLREGCRVVRQIENFQRDRGLSRAAEVEDVCRHLTVSRKNDMV